MTISLALVVLATASGTLATYLYDEGPSFPARLCSGACIGLTLLGLIGFVFALFLGLTATTITLSAVALLALSIYVLQNRARSVAISHDLSAVAKTIRRALFHPTDLPLGYVVFYLAVMVVLWRVFDRAVIELPTGFYTGVLNNFGDLPFHVSVITSFAFGNNFPPDDPTFAGVRFTYPFLTDFISAIFVRCGSGLRESMFIENYIIAVAFVGVLHRWALDLLRDRLAAMITPLLVFLSGGLGWILLWRQATQNQGGLFGVLKNLPASFTVIPETTWRWGNAVSTLLIPQRGMLLGLPLAVIVFTQWWLSAEQNEQENLATEEGGKKPKREKSRKEKLKGPQSKASLTLFPGSPLPLSMRRMIGAGVVAGLLPLVHAHSFVVVMVMGGCLALLQRRWREWIVFALAASVIAVPQMWWSTHGSAVDAKKFIEWQFGWDRGQENALLFWLQNTGLFIPLLVTSILWRKHKPLVSRRLLIFYLPFTLCFIVPNFVRLAPWVWDNIKVLFYWWLASAPLVALLLSRLWRDGGVRRAIAVALFICVTLAGSLDVAAITLRSAEYQIFDRDGIMFAELIKQETAPRSLIIHAPVHNHPVFLSGRRSLMGYPGHVWTHGLDYIPREREIRSFYAGAPEARSLIEKYGIEYVVVGPLERNLMTVNEPFISSFQKVGEIGEYRLYKVTPR